MPLKNRPAFYRAVRTADARKVKGVDPEPAIRTYCEMTCRAWALQVRAPLLLANGAVSKDFVVAHAHLNREDLIALRDALNDLIADADEIQALVASDEVGTVATEVKEEPNA